MSTNNTKQYPAKGQQLTVKLFHGLQGYEKIWHLMQSFTDGRNDDSIDEVWVLQHEPVFTQGQAGKDEHILNAGDIPVVKVDRGGQVTYHGPGQLVIYLMIDIKRLGIGARDLVSNIEDAIVKMLSRYGVNASPKADAPGVYVGDDKIASLGLRIRNGRSFHGLSLNVDMDLEPFMRINPCGYAGMKMIQLLDFEPGAAVERASGCLVQELKSVFGYEELFMEYVDEGI